jgi:hypothetical protein
MPMEKLHVEYELNTQRAQRNKFSLQINYFPFCCSFSQRSTTPHIHLNDQISSNPTHMLDHFKTE